MSESNRFPDMVLQELRKLLGDRNVLTDPHQRAMRAVTPAPFPLHRWKDHLPDVVVLPGSTEEVSGILELANKYRVPVVPRAGGTGLNDGAVPLRKGIVVDIKRMDQILEIDEDNLTVTTQAGINNQELSRALKKYDLWWPFDPASFPVSIVGGNIGTGAWSLISGISGHIPDLVLSMTFVLPTGKIVEIGEGGGRKIRKSSTGYRLKDLFIGHQGTLGIATEATLDAFPRPEAEFAAFFGYESFEQGYRNLGKMSKSFLRTMAAVALFDEDKLNFLKRDDEAYFAIPENTKSVMATAFYGTDGEVAAASKKIFEIASKDGGKYLGEEFSENDWASRHDRYHLALHGRDLNGNVMPSTWHDEEPAIPYSELPAVRSEWRSLVKEYHQKYGIFDYGGTFFYNNSPFRPWGDYLTEMDLFIPEMELDDSKWDAWVELTRKISEVSINHHGSISAAHGATRPGQDDMIQLELRNGMYDIMKIIKKTFDPNNIMNPGKFGLDSAYDESS
ncbi:MAG: FAD-binding oxidoreductase [Candidatus Bathyarchaeia archaeon]